MEHSLKSFLPLMQMISSYLPHESFRHDIVNDFFSSSEHTAYSSALILQFGIPVEMNLLIYDTGRNTGTWPATRGISALNMTNLS